MSELSFADRDTRPDATGIIDLSPGKRSATRFPAAAGRPREPAQALRHAVGLVSYAFQPIVEMRSGRCHGFEALLRDVERTPFADVPALLDAAFAEGMLPEIEARLLAKAVETFHGVEACRSYRLFLNIDPRSIAPTGFAFELPAAAGDLEISIEITERQPLPPGIDAKPAIDGLRRSGFRIALDDFGIGFASLKLLYETKPDYVKVDRFFVSGIDRNFRNRSIVSYLVNCARTLGILTVAEGIETEAEFYTCRDLGCDFAQGYIIARPSADLAGLGLHSARVEALNAKDRRRPKESTTRLGEFMERLPAVRTDAPKTSLLEYFRNLDSRAIAPVVNPDNVPVGLVRERDLKRFVYSRYGGELLRNHNVNSTIGDLVVSCPICDIHTPLERVIEGFSGKTEAEGIIIAEGGEYKGFLSSQALLRLVYEANLALAADQNPLTRLPGNAAIARHIGAVLEDRERAHALVYFDFDHFKPFNDTYGFRQGDRAILMFADRLQALASTCGGFVGHIGGDDFFLALSGLTEHEVRSRLATIVAGFRSDAESLYDLPAREAGFLMASDRDGALRRFPLLSVSGVAVILAVAGQAVDLETVTRTFAAHKAAAKQDPEKLRLVRI